ncbi:hypothetical protein HAX54_026646 [Datura stramonium]|uniref:Uncharacterized protein n=1 Tax=Datura stramonium TaxID=4076 RepID=A0ABS8V1B4_DATST|nr:hypothetical protein [Datura stramonium]
MRGHEGVSRKADNFYKWWSGLLQWYQSRCRAGGGANLSEDADSLRGGRPIFGIGNLLVASPQPVIASSVVVRLPTRWRRAAVHAPSHGESGASRLPSPRTAGTSHVGDPFLALETSLPRRPKLLPRPVLLRACQRAGKGLLRMPHHTGSLAPRMACSAWVGNASRGL